MLLSFSYVNASNSYDAIIPWENFLAHLVCRHPNTLQHEDFLNTLIAWRWEYNDNVLPHTRHCLIKNLLSGGLLGGGIFEGDLMVFDRVQLDIFLKTTCCIPHVIPDQNRGYDRPYLDVIQMIPLVAREN